MKPKAGTILGVIFSVAAQMANAQSLIITVTLGPNQIGEVKVAQGITTRIIFPEPVRDIICGDLYDPATGNGSFVVQKIDSDVFLKPVVSKGLSNLFVKTGGNGEHTYSFDLQIVAVDQAHRVVNIADSNATQAETGRSSAGPSEEAKKMLSTAQQQAGETIRSAHEQAERIVSQANQQAAEVHTKELQRVEELGQHLAERAQQEVEQRFVRAMIQGIREVKSADSRIAAKKISFILDPRVLTFDDRSYLRYTIKNESDKDFVFSALALERRSGKEMSIVPARIIQGRAENRLGPGEAIIGIIVFDPKEVGAGDKLSLYVRGQDNAEVGRLSIQ
jgi:vacuolar-type H+-ATPase subunit H